MRHILGIMNMVGGQMPAKVLKISRLLVRAAAEDVLLRRPEVDKVELRMLPAKK